MSTIEVNTTELRAMIREAIQKKFGALSKEEEAPVVDESNKGDRKDITNDPQKGWDALGKRQAVKKQEKKDSKDVKDAAKTTISKSQLREAITKAVKKALNESADSGVGKYAEAVDKHVEDSIESIDKLVLEGEELMKENPSHDYAIQERNHLIMARIGILKAMKGRLAQVLEDLYRNV